MAKIVMIIAPERFRDEELFQTKEELERAGHETIIASLKRGVCSGSRGGQAVAALAIDEVRVEDYEAVVFVGGGGSKIYFGNAQALQLAQAAYRQKKIVAAICLAPVILANAGLLKGKNATVAGTEARAIENQGAKYTGPGVTVDGRIITGNAPRQSRLFGQKISELLDKRKGN